MNALIFDDGQETETLIGAIGMASSLYSLRCRDEYFDWLGKLPETVARKNAGLRQIMDLAVCVAIPPYNSLLGGKLLAALALTEVFQAEHVKKYKEPLRAVVTTSATGLHCPIFNRIMLRPGGLYRRIGRTSGYTTTIYSRETLRLANLLLGRVQQRPKFLASASNPLRPLRYALRQCNLDPEALLRLGVQKGVYIATVRPNDLHRLRTSRSRGRHADRPFVSAADAFMYWGSTLLPRRLQRPDVLQNLKTQMPRSHRS